VDDADRDAGVSECADDFHRGAIAAKREHRLVSTRSLADDLRGMTGTLGGRHVDARPAGA
jgi:hypothetical protein